MIYTKTTEYALRALILLAQEEGQMLSSDSLHKKLKIPKKYLQKLLTSLSKDKLVKSVRGKYGGYKLGRGSKKIKLSHVIEAVEGFKSEPTCLFGFDKCVISNPCLLHDTWTNTQKHMITLLSNTSLYDLAKR